MNKMKLIAAAAALVAAVPAFAKIEVGNAPELALVVYDEVKQVSYTKDLGTFADAFKTQFSGNTAAANLSWDLKGDSNWTSFLSQANVGNLKWVVFGVDDFGGTAVGQKRLFTTALNTAANEAKVSTWTNMQFTNGIAPLNAGFLALLNDRPEQRANANASSVTSLLNDGKAYFAAGGAGGEFYNKTSPFSNSNVVGKESNFYYLTRSGAVQGNSVLVERFANTQGVSSTFGLGSDYVLTATAVAAVPEPSTYAMLMGGLLALGLVVRRRTNDKR